MPRGVTGNTSDSGSEESRFEPWRGNQITRPCAAFLIAPPGTRGRVSLRSTLSRRALLGSGAIFHCPQVLAAVSRYARHFPVEPFLALARFFIVPRYGRPRLTSFDAFPSSPSSEVSGFRYQVPETQTLTPVTWHLKPLSYVAMSRAGCSIWGCAGQSNS